MIGSLVIIFPNYFWGGELVVKYNGEKVVYDSSYMDSINKLNGLKLKGIFFYSNYSREVLPVKEYDRITITCNVIAENKNDESRDADSDIVDLIKNSKNKNIGIILSYQYTQDINSTNLKGNDLKLYNLLNENFNCKIQTVILENEKTSGKSDYDYSDRVQNVIYSCSETDFANFKNGIKVKYENKYKFYHVSSDEHLIIDEYHDPGAYYTGNESRDEIDKTWYLTSAILIDGE